MSKYFDQIGNIELSNKENIQFFRNNGRPSSRLSMMSTQTSSDVSLEFALAVKNRENDFNSEDEEDINEEMALLDMSKPRYSYQNLISTFHYPNYHKI